MKIISTFPKVFLGVSTLFCLAVSSCSDLDGLSNKEGETEITATIPPFNHSVRTCVDESYSSENEYGILWQKGDTIGVYSSASQNACFIGRNTSAVATTTFAGIVTGTPRYAYYPYAARNDKSSYTSVAGELPALQSYSSSDGRLLYDYKVGTPTSSSANEFVFNHIFALLRLRVNASGISELNGEKLESVELAFPDGVQTGGAFTVDLRNGDVSWGERTSNVITLEWSDSPALGSNDVMGYLNCAPLAVSGQEVNVTLLTENYQVTFTAPMQTDLVKDAAYTFPLDLAQWQNKEGANFKLTARPKVKALSFTAADNSGKILAKKLVYSESGNSGSTTCKSDAATTTYSMTVDGDSIVGCIPYLYDYTLKPSFTLPDGATLEVSTDGGATFSAYEDGASINFAQDIYLRVSVDGAWRIYNVKVTNTGLPIVVINQDANTATKKTTWTETGLTLAAKSSEWPTDGTITVYNADGTVNNDIEAKKCGVRLRGNSTQNYPKKPFAIKFDKKQNPLDIMGAGKKGHKRWVLLANWKDHSLMRNAVAFDLAHIFENTFSDGMAWNPRGEFVEVVYNGIHLGNYYLCEQIKIDADRLDIPEYDSASDADGPTIDDASKFGYLLESDDNYDENVKFTTKHYLPFMFKDDTDTEGKMLAYVEDIVYNIEQNLHDGNYSTAYQTLDLPSVVDYWLFTELVMNDELKHPKSVYTYINGGKLYAGPVWDFDWQSFPVVSNLNSSTSDCKADYSKSIVQTSYGSSYWWTGSGYPEEPNSGSPWLGTGQNDTPYMWYPYLFKSDEFKKLAASRWATVKAALIAYAPQILQMGKKIAKSWEYNYAIWPAGAEAAAGRTIRNQKGYAGDEALTFEETCNAMYNTLLSRISGMSFVESQTLPSVTVTDKQR